MTWSPSPRRAGRVVLTPLARRRIYPQSIAPPGVVMPKAAKFSAPLLGILLALGLPLFPSAASAAEKLLIVHSALNLLTSPLWMAKDKGYFTKYGLDVETVYIPSGTLGMQSLLGGETKI